MLFLTAVMHLLKSFFFIENAVCAEKDAQLYVRTVKERSFEQGDK